MDQGTRKARSADSPRISVLSIDDEPDFQRILRDALGGDFDVLTATTGEEAMAVLQDPNQWIDVILLDLVLQPGKEDGLRLLPRLIRKSDGVPVIMLTNEKRTRIAVRAMKEGAADYVEKAATPFELRPRVLEALSSLDARLQERFRLRGADGRMREMVGESAAMQRLRRRILQASRLGNKPILVTGETGAGKELVVKILHSISGRRGPLIARSCKEQPDTLIESLFFGAVEGAYTGSRGTKKGLLEQSVEGTLFLDELTKGSTSFQQCLLRVMEMKPFVRIGEGADQTRHFTGQLVLATNESPERAFAEGRLLEDFFHRTAATIHVPPLRERKEDIPLLVAHFLREAGATANGPIRQLSAEEMDVLCSQSWPGNVRQLGKAVLLYAVSGQDGDEDGLSLLEAIEMAGEIYHGGKGPAGDQPGTSSEMNGSSLAVRDLLDLPYGKAKEQLEIRYYDICIRWVRSKTGGSRSRMARCLGMSRQGLTDLEERIERWRRELAETFSESH